MVRQEKKRRLSIIVTGQVQGVGFRPTVYRLAVRHRLTGFVCNTTTGVLIEVQGPLDGVKNFLKELGAAPPPRAKIQKITTRSLPVEKEATFRVVKSRRSQEKNLEIPPDIATCQQCLAELLSPSNRRYLHPFINCTNCGPRYTIIREVPYDRANTTMTKFSMCKTCGKEYENPVDRRFHAQPNCCPECGPVLTLVSRSGKCHGGPPEKVLSVAASLLKEGKILAVKGLGGFHLAVAAASGPGVSLLRKRKHREEKPLALMAPDVEVIRRFCYVSPGEQALLCSWRAPIVLLRKKENCSLPEELAPGNNCLGFMLPYTPVHHLLFHYGCPEVLVMTSGNFSEEPIIYHDEQALRELKEVADFFLFHNRPIHVGCDDSVVWVHPVSGTTVFFRRSRGYAPEGLRLPFSASQPVLGCGGQGKNTFTLLTGRKAVVSQHVGELENMATYKFYTGLISHLEKLTGIFPRVIAYDLHPGYMATTYARERMTREGLPGVGVQHHHSHIAACLAENGVANRRVIGIACDGTGWGDDGTLWGGEFLLADYAGYERLAHLLPVALPGGEKAIRQPWRMAAVYLKESFDQDIFQLKIPLVRRINRKNWRLLETAIQEKINAPLSSSLGRLFDGVACLVTGREFSSYEGQPAMELEALAGKVARPHYPFTLRENSGKLVLDWRPLVRSLVEELSSSVSPEVVAGRFHETVAWMILVTCQALREKTGLAEVALSGGCFQNRLLLLRSEQLLGESGFTVYTHHLFPPNDGGISLGQAVVAAFQQRRRRT
ncbi:MAG TPA: carbamoyltransferase HypF [bacterium]|nr:carbamoyltransferase HypF [bacterium]